MNNEKIKERKRTEIKEKQRKEDGSVKNEIDERKKERNVIQ